MSLTPHKATYSKEPLRTVKSLCAMLRLEEQALRDLAAHAPALYRRVKPKPGSKRETFDALPRLKVIHKRIKTQVLERVRFPSYLTGSVKGRDYKENAAKHAGQRVVICEDVKGFFPSVTAEMVCDIWQGIFGCSSDVAQLLTQLTTKDGALPQGAIPSSYLANLVLWRTEPLVHAKLDAQGITYSRYVDDITMSSPRRLSVAQKQAAIGMVYGMLSEAGLRAGREKHDVFNGSKPMIVTKLVVNEKPSLTKKKRSAVRAAVFQFQQTLALGEPTADTVITLNKLAQRVGQLGRFHPREAAVLKLRLQATRAFIDKAQPQTLTTGLLPDARLTTPPEGAPAPWDDL
ncbi:MAG: RNA-directed DNA polymerase [Ramlibacter sp.]|nr:RNA-directed DNA polymerase [Ramlibacter sp.]